MSDPSPRRRGPRPLNGLAGFLADLTVQGMDLDAALADVDVDALIDRVDVNRLLDRVDVDRLLAHVDVDRLLQQVDVNLLLDRVDPDRLLDRVDVDRLVARAGIAEIVASSTGAVAGRGLDTVRRQILGLDVILTRVLRTLTGRGPSATPAPATTGAPAARGDAGVFAQALAMSADLALAGTLYTVFLTVMASTLSTVLDIDVAGASQTGPLFVGGLLGWLGLYFAGSIATEGRTIAMGVLGLRLTHPTGVALSPGRALAWVAALPLSVLPLGWGYAFVLLGERPRTLHDRLAGAVVVYDWGVRATGSASPLTRFIEAREGGTHGTGSASA